MAIREKIDKNTNNKIYEVYISITSELYPHIRKQRRKTKIESKSKALRIEKELYLKCIDAVREEENKGFSWESVVNKWYLFESTNKLSKIGSDTLDDYFNSMRIWTTLFWSKPAFQITRTDIRTAIAELDEKGKSKSYQNKIKQTINKIFTWGMEEQLIKNVIQSPTIGITINRKEEKKPEILTLSEVKTLLETAKKLSHPWYPVWALAILSGCRNGELYALTWSDVDLENNILIISKSYNTRRREIKSTKAGYYRNVPINSDLKNLLVELKNESINRKEVLPRLPGWDKGLQAKVLRTFLTGIGLPSVKFHTLRACFATILLQKNVAPATVMKVCGWKDLDTMARYTRLAAIDERGATDKLIVLPSDACNNIVEFINNS